MDFRPTDAQQMFAESVVRWLADAYDFRRRLKRYDPAEDKRLWTAIGELGLLGAELEEAYGGAGGSFEDVAAALSPMGAALFALPFVATVVVAGGLLRRGSDAQRSRWLPSLAAGRLRVCVAHSEHRARDTVCWVATSAARDAGGWRLEGGKSVVVGADSADLLLVSARTAGDPHSQAGISVFAVPRDAAGLKITSYALYDGTGAADLTFDGVLLPQEALLGDPDTAYDDLAFAWDRGAAAVCAEAIGAMDRLRDLTLEYLKTRQQFGRPIGEFQALQHRMADAYMAIELARSMSMLAVASISEPLAQRRSANISAAKVVVGEACREVGQTCVQLHGGIALTAEYAAGHYFKRLTMIARQFGNADHHLRRYAGLL